MRPTESFNRTDVTDVRLENPESSEYDKFANEIRATLDPGLFRISERGHWYAYTGTMRLKHDIDPQWIPEISDANLQEARKQNFYFYTGLALVKHEIQPRWFPETLDRDLQAAKYHDWSAYTDLARIKHDVDPDWSPGIEDDDLQAIAESGNWYLYARLARLKHDLDPAWSPTDLDTYLESFTNNRIVHYRTLARLKHHLDPSWFPDIPDDYFAWLKQYGDVHDYTYHARLKHDIDPTWIPEISEVDLEKARKFHLDAYADLARLKLDLLKEHPSTINDVIPTLPEVKSY